MFLDNRYRLGGVIARGGMSTVYYALDTRLDRDVAVKVMDPALAADPAFRVRFEREARAVARLSDPTLVNVFDQGVDTDGEHELVFLVMELVSGGSLRELLRERGPMPPHAALAVMESILTALAIAHAKGMIHRDIKPDNVLIAADHQVKLADFGLVRAISSSRTASPATAATLGGHTWPQAGAEGNTQHAPSQVIGTVAYLSPEQVAGSKLHQTSDVYSAGILLFELLTGRTPFPGGDPVQRALARLEADVPAPSSLIDGIPPELDELLAHACARHPEDRYADGAEFLEACRSVVQELHLPKFIVPIPRDSAVRRALGQIDMGSRRSWDDESMATRAVRIPQPPNPTAVMPAAPYTPAPAAFGSTPPREDVPGGYPPGPYPPQGAGAPHTMPPAPAQETAYQPHPDPAQIRPAARAPQPYAPAQQAPSTPAPAVHRSAATPTPASAPAARSAQRPTMSNRSPIGAIVWTALIIGLTVGLAVGGWWLTSGRYGEIPNVLGMDRSAALSSVQSAGFTAVADSRYSDSQPRDSVMGTDPPFGQRAPRGSQVAVLVSLGKPVVPEPAAGQTLAQFEDILRSRTLVPVRAGEEYSSAPVGEIASVRPQPGTEVSPNSQVKITVSKGPKPVTIPDVRGRSEAEATRRLETAGLRVDGTIREFDAGVDGGDVIRTDPPSGQEVPGKTAVKLVVSSALTVPDVRGKPLSQAREQLRQAGLDVRIGSPVEDLSVDGGSVARQSPEPGTRLDPSKTPAVEISESSAVKVPLVLGKRASDARDELLALGLSVRINGPADGVVLTQSSRGRVARGTIVELKTI